MPDWLLSVPAFIVVIGILVAVHEYGHFWVARRMGVRVLRYSIGFGHKLWSRTSAKTGTEYRISALPLGGYVKMLDEREGPVDDADKPYAFNRQHPLRRIAIVVAGPGINFVLAAVAYWLVFMIGVTGIKPMIDAVPAHTPAAQAGLQQEDRIVAVGNTDIHDWQDLRLSLLDRVFESGRIELRVKNAAGAARTAVLEVHDVPDDPEKLFAHLGLAPYQPPATPVVARVLPDSPAAAAGLEEDDRVTAINGQALQSPSQLAEWVRDHPGVTAELAIERDGTRLTRTVQLAEIREDGPSRGRLGAALGVDKQAWEAMRIDRRLGPLQAIPAALGRTRDVTVLTLHLMWQMVIGNVSWRSISGPIQIANYAGQTAGIGLAAFIGFMALVSISLGIINLLPIPVLDGGHLLYYMIEWIRGRPLSEAVQIAGQQAGLCALLLLMGLAFYNDILHLLG